MNKRAARILPILFLTIAIIGLAVLAIDYADNWGQPIKLLPCIGAAALLTVAIISLCLFSNGRKNRQWLHRRHTAEGLEDKKAVRVRFETANADEQQYYCLVYLAFDADKAARRLGEEKVTLLEKKAAAILLESCTEQDSAAAIDNGTFLMALCCKDGLEAQQSVIALTNRLNDCQKELFKTEVSPFRSGLYLPIREKASFDVAFANAKLGYRYASDNKVSTFICTKELLVKEESRKNLGEKLSRAIDDKQFEMFLQFIYSTDKNRFVSAEVLSRWNSPEEGILMPAYYINDMRVTGVIEKFDMYMLDKTCALLQTWKNTPFGQLVLSCNITRITISSPDFVKKMRDIVKKYDFDHHCLIFEITEDALIDDEKNAAANVQACKEDGFQIAIDDFSTGHSSLNDISNYPVDQIKIDRDMIQKAGTKRGGELLRGVVDLAHKMKIEVVCEGVETKKQRDAAANSGCDYIQGYYYSYVFPLEEGKNHYLDSVENPESLNKK